MTGKIIKGIAGFYYVHDGCSHVYECKAKGIFRNKKIKPLVGDNVTFTVLNEADLEGNIEEILPRRNELIRPAVSNVDQGLIIFSSTHPAPNLNLLDRFLVMMEIQEVPAIICFNKMDLIAEDEIKRYGEIYSSAGYQVLFTSIFDKSTLKPLQELVRGKTTVLAGPSGVGKSSLTNLIQPEAQMPTGIISKKIGRGKHTTRHSELFFVEKNTYMMDTPGFSSMYVEDLVAEKLRFYFPEFEAHEAACKFQGCVHMEEPVCGVKAAVEACEIGKSRYENYRLMYLELKNKKRY